MNRRALLIGNPGEERAANYCEGVLIDLQEYERFLKSPVGGLWADGEVKKLLRPNRSTVLEELALLPFYDYALVVFSGHGEYTLAAQSTILELKAGHEIDSKKLIACAPKQTTIIDCCREIRELRRALRDMLEGIEVMAKAIQEINPGLCRLMYDRQIESCSTDPVVMWSCKINEKSGDDEFGGYYSHNLLSAARDWVEATRPRLNLGKEYDVLSVASAHEDAKVRTIRRAEQSGHVQNPKIDKVRSGPYFPFAIVA